MILYESPPTIFAVTSWTCKYELESKVDAKLFRRYNVGIVLFNCKLANSVPNVPNDVDLNKLIVIVLLPLNAFCEYNSASKIIIVCINGILNTVSKNVSVNFTVPGVK